MVEDDQSFHPVSRESPVSTSKDTPLYQAFYAHREGRAQEAFDICREILHTNPNDVAALNLSGITIFKLGDTDQAISMWRKVLSIDPMHAAAGTNLGTTLRASGIHDEAERVLRQVTEVDPGNAESHFNLGRVLEDLGRHTEAKEAYQQCLTLAADHSRALLRLGNIAMSKGSYDDARAAYEKSLEADPLNAWTHFNLGSAYQELNALADAEQCFIEAVNCNPSFSEAWYNLGVVRLMMDRSEDAIEAYAKALTEDPTHVGAQMNIGNALQELGRLDEAEAAYRKAIAIAPDYDKSHLNLADLLMQKGDSRTAVALCERFLDANPGNTTVLAVYVMALAEAKDKTKLRRIADPDVFIQMGRIEVPAGYKDIGAFNDALARHILAHPTLTYAPAGHATRNGYHSGELLDESKGPVADLENIIHSRIETYNRSLPEDSSHPFPQRQVRDVELNTWAVVMESQGHQDAHIHPTGWISGVYYIIIPDAIRNDDLTHGGWIEFGRPGPEFHVSFEPDLELYCPKGGLMVLFPSYLYHGTIPFESSEQRICIAFDMVIHN